jgi:glycoside/pentoside/hexuronide:cation symporter, GPH family
LTDAAQPAAQRRLSLATALPFSAPSLPLWALGVAVFVYLPPYFAGHLGVSMTLIGAVWMIVRLVDIPVDVGLAVVMDRTRTRLGRYRLWLILGGPVLMLALYRLFMAPAGFSSVYLFGWLLVMYLGTSIMGLAHSAWAANLAPHYDDRSRLFGILTAVGVVGTIAVLGIMIAGGGQAKSDAPGIQSMGWFIIAMIPATVAVAAIFTPERIAPDLHTTRFPLKDYWAVLSRPDLLRLFLAQMALTLGPGWMSAIYLFFFKSARGFTTQQATILLAVYILAQIPGALLTAALARRIGKHRALMVTTTAFSLGLFAIFITPKGNLLATVPSMIWAGVMAAGFDLMIRAMLADVGDEVRLSQGKERISLLYAVNGLAVKIAAAFSIGVTFPLLAFLGFNPAEGAVNTAGAINHLEMSFLIGPIVFVMLGGACVIGWRLDARRHGEIRRRLDERDAELEASPTRLWDVRHAPPLDPEISG